MYAVVDTGVLVSALIRRQSQPGAVLEALRLGRFTAVYSVDILIEIVDVLGRPFLRQKYHVLPDDTAGLIHLVRLRGQLVTPTRKILACRDPRDDKFLEAAIAGHADYIVSGDADLLSLTPFEEIPVLRPAGFLILL